MEAFWKRRQAALAKYRQEYEAVNGPQEDTRENMDEDEIDWTFYSSSNINELIDNVDDISDIQDVISTTMYTSVWRQL